APTGLGLSLREEWASSGLACGDEDDEGRRGGGLHLRPKWLEQWWFQNADLLPMSPAPPVASHPTTPAPCSSFHHARSWFPPRSSPPQTAGSLPHSRSSSRTEICRSTTCGLSSPMAPSRTILRTAQPASPPLLLG
uniref:Uncharacterized protein n=1 Tax=Aegilops tauschii subsp. strangulata TaxID=200361 RepID=A0A452ZYV1_AEGTS